MAPMRGALPRSFDNFMTEKEKSFVSFLFAKGIKKKVKQCPEFYLQGLDRPAGPAGKTEEDLARELDVEREVSRPAEDRPAPPRIFEGVLGRASRKSTKSLRPIIRGDARAQAGMERGIMGRSKVEEIYDIVNREEACRMRGAPYDTASEARREQIVEGLKEAGEGLFAKKKGYPLMSKLLEEDSPGGAYAHTIFELMMEHSPRISASVQFKSFLALLIPRVKAYRVDPGMAQEEDFCERLCSNMASLLVGSVLLKLAHEQGAGALPRGLYQALGSAAGLGRLFTFGPAHHVWQFLALLSVGLGKGEKRELAGRLKPEMSATLQKNNKQAVAALKMFAKATGK